MLKEIHVRYILSAESIEKLNEKEKEVHRQLGKRQFQASCFLDEQERQFKASFVSFAQGRKLIRRKEKRLKGLRLPAVIRSISRIISIQTLLILAIRFMDPELFVFHLPIRIIRENPIA